MKRRFSKALALFLTLGLTASMCEVAFAAEKEASVISETQMEEDVSVRNEASAEAVNEATNSNNFELAASTVANGTCGSNLTWSLDSNGKLIVSGTGAMNDAEVHPKHSTVFEDYYYMIKSVVINNGVTSIGYGAFWGCENLTSISIPNSVTQIGDQAFCGCSSLKNISLPSNIKSIGTVTFSGCTKLQSITIPNKVSKIGEGAFQYCSNLKNVYYLGTKKQWNSIKINSYNTNLKNAKKYYNGATNKLGSGNAKAKYKISGTSTATYKSCKTSGTSAKIPASVSISGKSYKVTAVSSKAFENNRSLKKITISKNVKRIGKKAFYHCSKLNTITIKSKKLKKVGNKAFTGVKKTATIKVPSGKKKAYKKLFTSKTGYKKTMKIK